MSSGKQEQKWMNESRLERYLIQNTPIYDNLYVKRGVNSWYTMQLVPAVMKGPSASGFDYRRLCRWQSGFSSVGIFFSGGCCHNDSLLIRLPIDHLCQVVWLCKGVRSVLSILDVKVFYDVNTRKYASDVDTSYCEEILGSKKEVLNLKLAQEKYLK